ncbi:hypothetical protein D5086_018020 [Populus alba]|uniref:Uncharacterized protein n=1 Tax=Populus alba TaxID=43335 RepID=A0ACC4BP93_POPAL
MKLVVEVVDAHNLVPKDCEGSASPFVEIDFQNQASRTKTIPKNLNPVWNQKLFFDLDETKNRHHQSIEVSVYNQRRPIPGRNFLGEIGLEIYTSPESETKVPPLPSPPLPPPSNTPQPLETSASCSLPPTITHIAENTDLDFKTLAALPKAGTLHTSKAITEQPEKKISAIAETNGGVPEKEPKKSNKEPVKIRPDATQHAHQHQILQQPSPSVEKLPNGTPCTMHPANPPAHSSDPDDFDLKDTNPKLGERWPSGGAYGGRGWMNGERYASTFDLVEQMSYLYVRVVKAKDLPPSSITGSCDPYVEVKLGNYKGRTRHFEKKMNPEWNQVFAFSKERMQSLVLEVFVKDKEMVGRDDYLGRVVFDLNEVPTRVPPDSPLAPQCLPLNIFEKRLDHRPVHSRWFNLEKFGFGVLEADRRRELQFSSRIHLRVCLEGLLPMKMKDGRGSTDAYCVAKYGQKWVRTRTTLDTFNPKWNEQYTWEVYDPCTVITLGVFDNCNLRGGEKPNAANAARDSRIGKVRIRLSTLEAYRIYTHSYPLLVLHPHGVKKMGELQLAVRFTTLSLANMIYVYGHPLLPKMHYLHPFTVNQVDSLRYQAMNIVAVRLGRAEPPLRKEVVEYMLDVDSHMWSMRRSKANFFRIMSLISGLFTMSHWFVDICQWRNPITSVLVHILFLILIWYPELILPTLFLYMFLIGLWNYRFRPRHPSHMDTKLSWAEAVHPDELDEEFDTFPTSKSHDIVRMRYDRLRGVAGRIQTVVGDIATQGERFQSLLSWRDPRATSLFIVFCLCAAVVLYATPFRAVALVAGLYYLRHPRFRSKLPSVPSNFFKRLTARTDSLL